MRLLLAGGGTGGHLFPAIALAQRFLEEEWQGQVLFVGTGRGIEARILPQLGLPLKTIEVSGLANRSWFGRIGQLPVLLRSVRESLAILEQFAPHLVVGVGGYASGPALLAARIKGIPYLIHEQNALFGMTNRLLAGGASRICLTFPPPPALRLPGERVSVTGNPVRQEITRLPAFNGREETLLIFGGSRGARAINDAVVAALPTLLAAVPGLKILHQTGSEDLERIRAGYGAAGSDPGQVVPFIDDMAAAYRDARLVVCRAGATTLAELTACGRPAVLIPYPHAAADHQTANARLLAGQGAALLLPQETTDGPRLATLLSGLFNEPATLLRMAGLARSLGRPEATEQLLAQCRAVARRG